MKMITFILMLISFNTLAITFEVIGPCNERPQNEVEIEVMNFDLSVMEITNHILEVNKIPYVGAGNGIKSINNSPMGLDAMEIISDSEMRAHGWCYFVNGKLPDVLSSELYLESQEDHITWLYGYSYYDSGKWIGYCDPTWKLAPKQFCKK